MCCSEEVWRYRLLACLCVALFLFLHVSNCLFPVGVSLCLHLIHSDVLRASSFCPYSARVSRYASVSKLCLLLPTPSAIFRCRSVLANLASLVSLPVFSLFFATLAVANLLPFLSVNPQQQGSPAEYRFYTEFQSHEAEFDYLKSLEIEEKINQIEWLKRSNVRQGMSSGRTVVLWVFKEEKKRSEGEVVLTAKAALLPLQTSHFLLTTNDKTIKLWKVSERPIQVENGMCVVDRIALLARC